jgi:hypothetical protein
MHSDRQTFPAGDFASLALQLLSFGLKERAGHRKCDKEIGYNVAFQE